MRKSSFYLSYFALLGLVLSACGGDDEPIQAKGVKAALRAPFRFQRTIEVKPGLLYDVLTWGRGKDSTSALLILRSDSTHQQFKALNEDIEGKALDVWDMDLDTDGNPELVVQVRLPTGLNDLYIYEFDRSGNASKIRFPSFSEKAKAGYKGKDSIYMREGELRRDFLFQEPESNQKPVNRTLAYRLVNNALQITELTEKKAKK